IDAVAERLTLHLLEKTEHVVNEVGVLVRLGFADDELELFGRSFVHARELHLLHSDPLGRRAVGHERTVVSRVGSLPPFDTQEVPWRSRSRSRGSPTASPSPASSRCACRRRKATWRCRPTATRRSGG